MVNQFTRLRDGDRFFYLNETFTPAEQAILNQGNTLAKVIEANTNITNLQSNVFLFKASISGTVNLNLFGGNRGGIGLPGLTVQLQDTSGDILATTTTGRGGSYSFNQLSTGNTNLALTPGVSGTGTYQIVVVLPSFLEQIGQGPGTITVTRGGQNFPNVNFEVGLNFSGTSPQSFQADLSSLQSILTGSGAQSTVGDNGGTTEGNTGDYDGRHGKGWHRDDESVGITQRVGKRTVVPANELVWHGHDERNAGGSAAASSSSGANSGVVDSADSSDSGSSGAGGSANPPTQSLDAAFEEFSKIADSLK